MILGFLYIPIPNSIGVHMTDATNSYCPPKSAYLSGGPLQGTTPAKVCSDAYGNPSYIGVNGIFHDDEGFDNQYCEYLQPGPIKQPWATWSAPLGFGPLGLAFLIIYARTGPNGKPFRNRMTATLVYPLTLALVIIINGPGSMIFHTTFNGFWSELDPCGMCLFTAYVSAYNIVRIANIPYGWFWLMFLGMLALAVFLIFYIGGQPNGDSTPVFAGSVGIAMLTQFFTVFVCKVITHRTGVYWFWGGLLVFVLALTIWALGHTGSDFLLFPWGCNHVPLAASVVAPDGSFRDVLLRHVVHLSERPRSRAIRVCTCRRSRRRPPGPPLDDPEPAENGVRHNRYLTVKFQDSSTAIHANQPRSMRKYRSDNTPMRWHVMITPVAEFRPKDKGYHPVPINGASGPSGSGAASGSSAAPGPGGGLPSAATSSPDAPPGIPSLPSMPGLPPSIPT